MLTIVIPTWNRSSFPKENLKKLTSNIDSHQINEIEILVVDNASTDNTAEVVSEYQKRFEFIKYVKNDKDIGPTANFLKAISLVNTKYLHLLGDDDFLSGDYFTYFPEILLHSNYGVIFLNAYGFNYDADQEKPYCLSPGINNIKDYDSFVLKCRHHITFISNFVLNTDLAKSKHQFETYSDIIFSQVVYFVAQQNLKNIHIKDYLVAAKRNNANIENFQQVFMCDFINVINSLDGIISARCKKQFLSKYLLGYLPLYIFRETLEYPDRKKELLDNINRISSENSFLKYLLTQIVTIDKKYSKFYAYSIVLIGRLYANGLIDTATKALSFIKVRFRKFEFNYFN